MTKPIPRTKKPITKKQSAASMKRAVLNIKATHDVRDGRGKVRWSGSSKRGS